MTDVSKLANIPLAKPGFDTLGMSAPIIVQLNPGGKWENKKPESLDEERLKAVVQHLYNSNTLQAAQSYCKQCADDNKLPGTKSNYVPVIMMPIFPADQCPFDMNCEVGKLDNSKPNKDKKKTQAAKDAEKDDDTIPRETKAKKRGYVLQRLTDFDLISQW